MSDLILPGKNGGGPRPARQGVAIGVVCGEFSRFSSFWTSMIGAMGSLPPGSGLTVAKSVDVVGNCNALCRRTLEGNWSHLFIMGDDHVFEPEIILQLLAHDADVIVPHCLKRYPPWMPVVFSHQNDDGDFVKADLPASGPVQIHAAGSAGMLIRRGVLEALEDPWFQTKPGAGGLNEDLYFCEKVRDAGFTILCDPAVALGHIALHVIRPVWEEGGWHTQIDHDESVKVTYRSLVAESEPVPV